MDILKTDGPIINYFINMNILYINLDVNNECYRGQDFQTMTLVVTAYTDSTTTESIYSWSRTYERHQLNIKDQIEDLPEYNIYVELDNHWYDIQLRFNYDSDINGGGGNSYESKTTKVVFDNTVTIIDSHSLSQHFCGVLRDRIQKSGEFNVWFDTLDSPDSSTRQYNLNDLISNKTGTMVKQISNVFGPQVIPADINYQNMVRYILNHKDLNSILSRYFPLGIPQETTFSFKFIINSRIYTIHFIGNLKEII